MRSLTKSYAYRKSNSNTYANSKAYAEPNAQSYSHTGAATDACATAESIAKSEVMSS